MHASILPRHALMERRRSTVLRSCLQRPTRHLEPFGQFLAPRNPPALGAKKPIPAASTGRRSGHFGTHLGATGGTQTHARRTGRKLRQVHRARQGLVRVPESNTKYGGNRGKTGVTQAPSVRPSISESSEIPKRKKLFRTPRFRLRPAVHRATIYCVRGVALKRLT